MTVHGRGRVWMSVAGVAISACSGPPQLTPDAANAGGPDVAASGSWHRCCSVASVPGFPVQTRGTGANMECFCPAGAICNYEQTCTEADAGPDTGFADTDIADTGFADSGPLDDAAIDALVQDGGGA